MMRFTLTIDCDGAAFEDDPAELSRLVRKVGMFVEGAAGLPTGEMWAVRDSNGNTCGAWSVTA